MLLITLSKSEIYWKLNYIWIACIFSPDPAHVGAMCTGLPFFLWIACIFDYYCQKLVLK
jgi:hypothetical protein